MFYNLMFCFVLFLIYSTIGWMMEVTLCSIQQKKLVDRGFLIGPYCPIYGVSAIIIIFLLKKYETDVIALFVMATIICSIMEYLTSYFMEKIFHTRWWDYTHMKFNINGRICLSNSILFGVLGLLLMYFINPFFQNILLMIPKFIFIIISIILLLVFISDVIVSFNIINKIKLTAENVRMDKTEEITKKVREILQKKSLLYRRVANAFPNLEVLKKIKLRKDVKENEK